MKFTIHDVGHGSCVSLIHQNGNVMLWDCGQKEENRPSEFIPALGMSHIDYFFVTNYDEDHISDLPSLKQAVRIRSMYRNKSMSADHANGINFNNETRYVLTTRNDGTLTWTIN